MRYITTLILLLVLLLVPFSQPTLGRAAIESQTALTIRAIFGGTCCSPGQYVVIEGDPFLTGDPEFDAYGKYLFWLTLMGDGGATRTIRPNYIDLGRLWFIVPPNLGFTLRAVRVVRAVGPAFDATVDVLGVGSPTIRPEGYYTHFLAPQTRIPFSGALHLPQSPLVVNLTLYATGLNAVRFWSARVQGTTLSGDAVDGVVPAEAFPINSGNGQEHFTILLPRLADGDYFITLTPIDGGASTNTMPLPVRD